MGKVKVTDAWVFVYNHNKYQFPMGKVKMFTGLSITIWSLQYQFPMGKVKNNILYITLLYILYIDLSRENLNFLYEIFIQT